MQYTGLVPVADKNLPVRSRYIVLVRDARITRADGKLKIEIFAYRHRVTVAQTNAEWFCLITAESVGLDVALAAECIEAEIMTQRVTKLAAFGLGSCLRRKPPTHFTSKAKILKAIAVVRSKPPRTVMLVEH